MKDGEKYCYRGYYIAHVSNPQPDSVFLNSSFGLTCLEAKIETILDLNTSSEALLNSMETRKRLFSQIQLEDFTLANQLLSVKQLRIYSVKIEQYEPLNDSDDSKMNTLF